MHLMLLITTNISTPLLFPSIAHWHILPNNPLIPSSSFNFFLNMSIKSCVVLFILCLSLYACHGLRPTVSEKNSIKKQKKEKISDVVPMMKKPTLSKEGGFPKEESVKDEINYKLKDGKAKVHSAKALTSSQITESPLGSVSWRVSHHEEHDEQNPGFNVDYSAPKTHPPSHN